MRAVLIISLFTLGCDQWDNSSFYGSWYSCDYIGQYSEIHISRTGLINNWYGLADWHITHDYEIQNDTLFYYDTLYQWRDENGNPGIISNQFVFREHNLIWSVKMNDSLYQRGFYSRMPLFLEEYHNNDTMNYEWRYEQYRERESQYDCQDQRSKEEIITDSVEMEKMIKEIQDFF